MQFGFTLKPEHTLERTLALTRQAEAAGFDYGWLFDCHVLWRDPYPLLTLMAGATERMRLGTCVTNPGPASRPSPPRARDARRDLRRPDGPRHRPRRFGAARPRQAADHDGRTPRRRSASSGRSSPARRSNTRARSSSFPWTSGLDAPGLGRGLRPDGPGDDRPRRRRAHPPARRPGPHPLVRRPGPRGRDGRRPRPASIKVQAAAPAHVGAARARAASGRAGSRRSCRNHVVDLVNKYPREQLPASAHRLRPGPRRATTTTTTPRSARPTRPSSATRSPTGSASSARSTSTSPSCASSPRPASTSSTSTS